MSSALRKSPTMVAFAWWLILVFPIFLWLVEGNFEIKLLMFSIFPYALHSLENYNMMEAKMETILGATVVSYIVLQAALIMSGRRERMLNDQKQRIIVLLGYSTMFCFILALQLHRRGFGNLKPNNNRTN